MGGCRQGRPGEHRLPTAVIHHTSDADSSLPRHHQPARMSCYTGQRRNSMWRPMWYCASGGSCTDILQIRLLVLTLHVAGYMLQPLNADRRCKRTAHSGSGPDVMQVSTMNHATSFWFEQHCHGDTSAMVVARATELPHRHVPSGATFPFFKPGSLRFHG